MTIDRAHGLHVSATEWSPKEQLRGLMDHYEQSLCNFLYVMLGDRDAALDCTQDTFLRAYESLCKGNMVNAQWLYKVARNRAVDEFRHRKRERSQIEALECVIAQDWCESDRTRMVREVLARLNPTEREVLYLFSVDKFETAQIAAMLGIQPGAVRMRLVRARERFRTLYRQET